MLCDNVSEASDSPSGFDISQVQFTLDANFKLDDLLKLELHKFADEVGEIVDCAQKEEKMEQGLAKLKVTGPCWHLNHLSRTVLLSLNDLVLLSQTTKHTC